MTMLLKQKRYKPQPSKLMTYYDNLHTALTAMVENPIPRPKNRMMMNRRTQELLISKDFVYRVTDKKLLANCDYKGVPNYLITEKGHEYIKRYEHLRELLDE